jgi:hypothetical protein
MEKKSEEKVVKAHDNPALMVMISQGELHHLRMTLGYAVTALNSVAALPPSNDTQMVLINGEEVAVSNHHMMALQCLKNMIDAGMLQAQARPAQEAKTEAKPRGFKPVIV